MKEIEKNRELESQNTANVAPAANVLVTSISFPQSTYMIEKGGTLTLNPMIVPPRATNKSVRYQSSDSRVALVNMTTGVVTARDYGEAIITAYAQDGSGVRGECTIVVPSIELRVHNSNVSGVTINKTPSESGASAGIISNNTTVYLIDEKSQNVKWYHIYGMSSSGTYINGWCLGDYLQKKITMYGVKYQGGIIVRESPSLNSVRKDSYMPGSWIIPLEEVLGSDNQHYYKIRWFDSSVGTYMNCYVTAEDKDECYVDKSVWQPLIAYDVSDNAVDMLKVLESYSPTALRYGNETLYTIGYGHVIDDGGQTVNIGGVNYTTLTKELATTLLWEDLRNKFIPKFNSFLTSNRIALTQNQYDACILDCYQKGENIWINQVRDISHFIMSNEGFDNYSEVVSSFLDGVEFGEDNYNRRMKEADLFCYCNYWKVVYLSE